MKCFLAVLFVAGLGCSPVSAQTAEAPAPIPIFTQGAKILFQGDSITDGNRGRSEDPNHILGHGFVFLIAAKYGAAFPDSKLTFINRGISGHAVPDLEKRWREDTLALQPDILSVLVGANDSNRDLPIEDYEAGYDRILAQARAQNPNVKLVLCEPFVFPVGARQKNWGGWWERTSKQQAAVARLAKKYGAALVKFQGVFERASLRAPTTYWIWDGVHPTYAGHQLMADEWVRTVRAFWVAP